MMRKPLPLMIFLVGIFLLEVHTTFPALWLILGIPGKYPFVSDNLFFMISQGFTAPLGVVLMFIAGLVYGSDKKEISK